MDRRHRTWQRMSSATGSEKETAELKMSEDFVRNINTQNDIKRFTKKHGKCGLIKRKAKMERRRTWTKITEYGKELLERQRVQNSATEQLNDCRTDYHLTQMLQAHQLSRLDDGHTDVDAACPEHCLHSVHHHQGFNQGRGNQDV